MGVCCLQRDKQQFLSLQPSSSSCFRRRARRAPSLVQWTKSRRARLCSKRTTTENWGVHAI